MKNKANDKIDFVVLWVDPNDKEWQKERAKYSGEVINDKGVDNDDDRYRDWDLFKYWFRGVEKYAPWVNKVHLVTCGHLPKWLNEKNPKINIVKHSDIIDTKCLPTFNSNAILLNVHKIPDLSEHFVLFNDDEYIVKPVKPTDFFKKGIPVDTMSLLAITPSEERKYCRTLVNNIETINNYFDFRKFKKQNLTKCLSPKQGKYLLTTIPLLLYDDFPGFKNYHIGNSYLKSTFSEIWEKEHDLLANTVATRFRDYNNNVSEWLMNYWQFAEGKVVQRSAKFGINICMDNANAEKIIRKQKRHIVCLSEPEHGTYSFEELKESINACFEKILPQKGGFEK